MDSLRDWFAGEMKRLGFAGLEGVFEYLTSMSDGNVQEYLESLLGTEPEIQAFAMSYLSRRTYANATAPSTSQAGSASSDAAGSTWEGVGGNRNNSGSKKAKRGRGKNKSASTNGSNVKRDVKTSFAGAVANDRSSTPNSAQANAIKNSPVEQVRQKVREYRKSKRVVNCIRCGKIEEAIREDGACSFCQAPIFSIWERDGASATADSQSGSPSRARPANTLREYRAKPVVLGRYVFPPHSDSGLVRDIAGRTVTRDNTSIADGVNEVETSVGVGTSSDAFRAIPNIQAGYLEKCYSSMCESLKDILIRKEPGKHLPLGVHGRLQLDDISPNVPVYM